MRKKFRKRVTRTIKIKLPLPFSLIVMILNLIFIVMFLFSHSHVPCTPLNDIYFQYYAEDSLSKDRRPKVK